MDAAWSGDETPTSEDKQGENIQGESNEKDDWKKAYRYALRRSVRIRPAAPATIVAWDLETDRIKAGTPGLRYLTAYSQSPYVQVETVVSGTEHLLHILEQHFLVPESSGYKYVAWNSNNFDGYFLSAAILLSDAYIVRPYLTKSNSLRGIRVTLKSEQHLKRGGQSWEFLDGIAMLGLAGTSLEKFLITFAPNYQKLSNNIDFEKEDFDPENEAHRAYALRDSIGLWHGMKRAQDILLQYFNQPLTATMGNACIKIFKMHIPHGTAIFPVPESCLDAIRGYALRGGYCYCNRMFDGFVWKYDINQAYAAAMRECNLPAGKAVHANGGPNRFAIAYIARVRATKAANKIPFYYRTIIDGKIKAQFSLNQVQETWLTSIEIDQLEREGWSVTFLESWSWTDYFKMSDYVNNLEKVRTTCEGGPSGAIGIMTKAVGNHSVGKTAEQLENTELIMAAKQPPGFHQYFDDSLLPIHHTWFRFTDPKTKDYHQPQINTFVTAHVRMVVRRAALLAPDHWLYADTDCVIFSKDVTNLLDIDPKRYGAWKLEAAKRHVKIIAKKVYFDVESEKGSAKGMNVKRLKPQDYELWFEGKPPTQHQVQKQNFVKVMQGMEMFADRTRRGTAVKAIEKSVR